MSEPLEYTGKYQPTPAETERERIYPYLPGGDLIEAVNLAIALQIPLLLEGEAGCGKTRLASAIAYEFTQKYLKSTPNKWPYYSWKITSETRLKDGLYTYDFIAKLGDVKLLGIDPNYLERFFDHLKVSELINRLKENTTYREWGLLGLALKQQEHRPILLIDRIDRASINWGNDLPLEWDELRFEVKETGEVVETETPPIIIITQNEKAPLPNAFLGRCLHFYLEFPDEEHLQDIIQHRFPKLNRSQNELVEDAIACCLEMREIIKERPEGRPPGTREFIEFIAALLQKPAKQARIALENLPEQTPLLGILLKSKADRDFYQNYE